MANPTPLRPEQRTLSSRVDRQVNALMVLARRWSQYEGNKKLAFQVITETAAVALEVERAGIWLLEPDGSALVCGDLYEKARHRHSTGYRFTRDAAPAYFTALQTETWIQAVDAHSDPRTAPFAASYLLPYGVGALADVVIRVGGRPAGVLRLEQVGGARTFQSDEMTSTTFLASLAALALELERSTRAEGMVTAERAVTHAALDASGAAVLVLDQSGNVLHWNRRLLELFGMHETLMGPAGNGGVRIQHIAERTTDPARFIARFRRVSAEPEGHTEDVIGLVDGRRIVRASCPLPDGGGRAWSFRVVSDASGPG